jgi:hypothetical protein
MTLMTFHFNALPNQNPPPHRSDKNLLRLVVCVQTLPGSILSLYASIMSVHDTPRLHVEPLQILNFDFKADPDQVSHANKDNTSLSSNFQREAKFFPTRSCLKSGPGFFPGLYSPGPLVPLFYGD